MIPDSHTKYLRSTLFLIKWCSNGLSNKRQFNSLWTVLRQAIIIAQLIVLIALKTNGQENNHITSNASFAEKVYLQLDGKIYTTGNIVWFKCIVANAYGHAPSSLSGVLYVELIGPDETIHEKKLVKIENGIGEGFFYLYNDLAQGSYLIRAYTQWNKNFGTDFLFKEYIQVFAPQNHEIPPISDVTLKKEQVGEDRLEACFNPLVLDSLHKNKLTVYITIDNKKDSLVVKKGKDNKYRMDYTIPNESQFATLQMQTSNQKKHSKTIVLNNDFVDLQFFPESGELVHGLQSKVGFKALDANGQGMVMQGDIVDEQDSVLASFNSNILGMGSFVLNKVDSAKTYFARVTSQSEVNQHLLYPLPDIASFGNVLSVDKMGNNTLVTTLSNYMPYDSIYLRISCRGMSLYEMKVKLKENAFRLIIPNDTIPEGIIAFTMLDKTMQPVAERLYFNERADTRLNIKISSDKDTYAKRELANVDIQATNFEGNPINANLSLLVINKQQLGKMQSRRQNILSWFLLDSELKGEIENPGFYFNQDSSMHSQLDALMLTQGWRKYNYIKPFSEPTFQPESNLTVTGIVSSALSKKKKKDAKLTLATFGKSGAAYVAAADSFGRFNFNLDDEYGQNINALIQSSKKSGKKVNYNIALDKKQSPPIDFNQAQTIEKLDSLVHVYVEKNIERKIINDAFPLQDGNILIEEVEVQGYNLTQPRKKVMEKYGEPDKVIDGEAILAKEEIWSYGLYSVLQFNRPDKVVIERRRNGILYAKILGADATLVVIDGIPVQLDEYQLIPNIPTSEVSSFEIIECASNFYPLYYEVYGFYPDRLLCGAVIAVYTHGQKGLYGANKPVGLMKTTVSVFSAPREFYAPKYEKLQPDDWNRPDFRALIHWEPILKTDSLGKASASFFNADNVGEMTVVVEAISENGEIGYKEIDYKVEGDEKTIFIVN